jgi:hypothetical protein
MLDEGVYATVSEIGEAEGIDKGYVSRVLRLALLAPNVVEGILEGKPNLALTLEQLERLPRRRWDEQRKLPIY